MVAGIYRYIGGVALGTQTNLDARGVAETENSHAQQFDENMAARAGPHTEDDTLTHYSI